MPAVPAVSRTQDSQRQGRVSPARVCAFTVLRRVFEEGAWADRALQSETSQLDLTPRDRALATQLTFGAVQRRATLDHFAAELAGRPVALLEPGALAALRLGLFQLAYLDRAPAHAVVGESVELAKRSTRGGSGLVNAVLRRATREVQGMLAALDDSTPRAAALRHSHPEWMVALWWEALGAGQTRALLAANNRAAESALRANTLRVEPDELLGGLGTSGRAGRAAGLPEIAEAIVLDGPFDAHGSAQWTRGELMPQSRAAMGVSRLLDPQPGDRVLDLCAAPGGKTTHLAALMRDRGEIIAVERHQGRAAALRRTAARMGASIVSVREGDAALIDEPVRFDRVLVDPPCTDLGTLRSRPDARWRKTAEQPARLAKLQGAMLRAGAAALRPGGTLVYSTCTISPVENEGVVSGFLSENTDFEADDLQAEAPVWKHPSVPCHLQTLPHRDATDGFFIARLHRRSHA